MAEQQVEYIAKLLPKYISIFDKKRQKNKFLSLSIKLTSTAFAAAITILLGLNVGIESKAIYANIALILSALIAVLNTWDAFFNHKALWVKFTVATQSIRCIQEDLEFLLSRTQGEPTEKQIELIHSRFRKVIMTMDKDWENLRKEDKEEVISK
jgi:hypothetical protein